MSLTPEDKRDIASIVRENAHTSRTGLYIMVLIILLNSCSRK